MSVSAIQLIYVAAGLLLPLYYLPQIRRCLRDQTLLCSFSMGKAGTQLALRAVMMPFVFSVGDMTMCFIVSLDFLGRTAEFVGAVVSLRRQGQSWGEIRLRAWPLLRRFGRRPPQGEGESWDAPLTMFGQLDDVDRNVRRRI